MSDITKSNKIINVPRNGFIFQRNIVHIGYQIWWHNDGFPWQWGITGPGLKSAVNEGHHSDGLDGQEFTPGQSSKDGSPKDEGTCLQGAGNLGINAL